MEMINNIGTPTIYYDPLVPCLVHTTSEFMMSGKFRIQMNDGLELVGKKIKHHGNLGWLTDISKTNTFIPQDIEWWANHLNPDIYAAGIKYMAFVIPEIVFTMATWKEYSEPARLSDTVTVNHFKDVDSAKAWLKEVLNEKSDL